MPETYEITFQGQVQGVGFRPYIYKMAQSRGLKGMVFNNSLGVKVTINASKAKADAFLKEVLDSSPPNARILNYHLQKVEDAAFSKFKIDTSKMDGQVALPLTSDFAICDECKSEIYDTTNRRYFYPFTTCTNCGPRYAITTSYPFERENTSIVNFRMCPDCQSEYADPSSRRFHSQTNSCQVCGIKIWLAYNTGERIDSNAKEVINEAAGIIKSGKILALKNTSGYLLCCDATNPLAVQTLRDRKLRPTKPLAVLYPSLDRIKKDFHLLEKEEKELNSTISPIVILDASKYKGSLAIDQIAPNLNQLGVMIPTTPLLDLLMSEIGSPIVATSGNIHGSPIIDHEQDAVEKLSTVADCFLHHDLHIATPQDDSVVKFTKKANEKVLIRRSRGIAPNFWGNVSKQKKHQPVLAMGSHLKNTFTFSNVSNVYTSQYIGNLDNYEVYDRLKKSIREFTSLFDIKPITILVDKHSQYQSTLLGRELAAEWNADVFSIQHHKAHFASVLAEHNLFDSDEKVLGVVWDGTGMGDDGHIWGGEFFLYENQKMTRKSHFEYFDWLANDKMAKEPRLSLLSLLAESDREAIKEMFDEAEWKIYKNLLLKNQLKTSSVGRLFDAVAAALGISELNTFEGEAAMILENRASQAHDEQSVDYLKDEEYSEVPVKLLIQRIFTDRKNGKPVAALAKSFLFTLANIVIYQAAKFNASAIALSGGVFQNTILLDFIIELTQNKFNLLINQELSPNDENISLGQLSYYLNIKE